MIYKNFLDFQKNVAPLPHRIMGLDVGNKTVGASISDSNCKISSPLKTIQRKGRMLELQDINQLAQAYDAKSLVVGYPIHMHGEEGERCEYVQRYAESLIRETGIPILLWDERMSTMSAERILLEHDLSRAKRKMYIDAIAASIILQSFLDFLQHQ